MPRLINPKHEEIAAALAKGVSQTKAYFAAFTVKNERVASVGAAKLMRHPRNGLAIRNRRDELISYDQAKERQLLDRTDDAPLTKSWVLRQYMEVVRLARAEGNLAAMNRALEMLGKEIGMFKDKGVQRQIKLDDLSLDDLEKLIANLEADPQVQAGMAETSAIDR